ncbi:hypothetical protein [Clostridium sp. Marseille-P299]|uniref:hypothetical protein n=1 Tax=Clostridium sp. Marseille-P299 TaxID=1805477 RepID=UPI000836BD6E|nr:hypothetical protein [Clostridium sp. Marseille-P299]
MFFKSKYLKELDALLQQLKMNQENNYKDAAQEDFQKFSKRLEELKSQGSLKEKDYMYYCNLKNQYASTLKNYTHKDQKCSW